MVRNDNFARRSHSHFDQKGSLPRKNVSMAINRAERHLHAIRMWQNATIQLNLHNATTVAMRRHRRQTQTKIHPPCMLILTLFLTLSGLVSQQSAQQLKIRRSIIFYDYSTSAWHGLLLSGALLVHFISIASHRSISTWCRRWQPKSAHLQTENMVAVVRMDNVVENIRCLCVPECECVSLSSRFGLNNMIIIIFAPSGLILQPPHRSHLAGDVRRRRRRPNVVGGAPASRARNSIIEAAATLLLLHRSLMRCVRSARPAPIDLVR